MASTAQHKPNGTRTRRVTYPTSDGKPFAETDWHFEAMADTIMALKIYFAERPDVYVSGNNFVYWEEGSPKARVSPDVYVVFGVPGHLRDCYLSWEEGGRLPNVILEATSRKTRREDMGKKLPLYEQVWKTPECFFFDPKGDYLAPRLQGYRLQDGRYVRLEPIDGRLHSEQLSLDFVQEGEFLRLFNPQTGRFLWSGRSDTRRVQAATRRADTEAHRAEAETLRAETEARRAEEERRRAEAETRRADAAAEARRVAEAEGARLRAELEALKRRGS